MRRQQRFAQHGCAAVLALTLSAVCALGQPAPLESRQVPINVDSGLTQNVPVVDLADAAAVEPLVVFVTEVSVPGASWLRLNFDQVLLSGDPAAGNASYLQITSVLDGAQQRLNADHVVVWSSTSAFFNGDTVFVELYAFAGTGANRLVMSEVTAGEPQPETICGPTDDRLPSGDARQGRLLPPSCPPANCFPCAPPG